MNTAERGLPIAVLILIAGAIVIGAIVAAASFVGGSAQATHVTPQLLAGASNDGKACTDLQGSETWEELKLEDGDLTNGPHTDGTLEVTISNLTDLTFDWTSNIGVDGVVVKDGVDGANFYLYDPEDTADTDLSVPGERAISHISFCYDLGDAPTPTATPTATATPPDEATPTPAAAVLGETQEPEALPTTGGSPEEATVSSLYLLLGLAGLALLIGGGTLVAVAVRRRR